MLPDMNIFQHTEVLPNFGKTVLQETLPAAKKTHRFFHFLIAYQYFITFAVGK